MKSMLHEASNVVKAIEKAWADSGKPREFTINVLEVGEKNFLGFSKRPAIVSITYDPKKQLQKMVEKPRAVHKKDQKIAQTIRPLHTKHAMQQKLPMEVRPTGDTKLKRLQERQKQQEQQPRQRIQHIEQKTSMIEREDSWTPELVADVKVWLAEIIEKLALQTNFECSIDNHILRVMFDKNLASNPDDERQIFVSLSYLILQFLKKKHKKKLRGFHLVINAHASHEKSKQSFSQS